MDTPKFKVYLDKVLLADEPQGLDNLVTEIKRDLDIHGLLITTSSVLTFLGDGYDYLNCVYDSKSFCSEVKIEIEFQCSEEEQFEKIVDGILRVSEFRKPDLSKCLIACPIEDNTYFARIKNNRAIKAYPHVGKSKNGIEITPAVLEVATMFDPKTGLWDGATRKAYRVFELWKFIIAFISDDEIGFRSSLYDIGGKREGLFITNGKHLSTSLNADYEDPDIGKFSFQELVDECYDLDNIGFRIDISGVKPVFVLEENDGFYKLTVSDILQNAKGVSRKVKTNQLYSLVNFGSTKTDDDPRLSFPENINFIGFKDETLHLTGQCNIETILNIKGQWIRATNVIQDTLMGITQNPQDSYDQDFIFVECEKVSPGVYDAIRFDIFEQGGVVSSSNPRFYNGNLTNDKIALRFLRAIPNSIAEYVGNGNDEFFASLTHDFNYPISGAGLGVITQNYDDDSTGINFDPNNTFTLNSRFTAPQAGFFIFESQDYYSLEDVVYADVSLNIPGSVTGTFTYGEIVTGASTGATARFIYYDGSRLWCKKLNGIVFANSGNETVTGGTSGATGTCDTQFNEPVPSPVVNLRLYLSRFDSANNLIQRREVDYAWSNGSIIAFIHGSFILNQDDYVKVQIEPLRNQARVYSFRLRTSQGGYFTCINSSTGGGIYQTNNPEDFKSEQYTLSYPISYVRFKNIKANPMDKLGFNVDGITNITPWIENLKYFYSTKAAQITLFGQGQVYDKDCRPSIELEEDGGKSLREDSGLSILESQ